MVRAQVVYLRPLFVMEGGWYATEDGTAPGDTPGNGH